MKSLITLSLFGLLLLGTTLATQAQQSDKKAAESADHKITLNIKGMVCSMCEKNMKGSLEKLDGVKKVEKVDAKEGVASLLLTEGKTISDDQFKKAVEKAGFKLKKVIRASEKHSGHSQ